MITPNGYGNYNFQIEKINLFLVRTIAGKLEAGFEDHNKGTSGKFDRPMGITIGSNQNVYVADFGNNSIRVTMKD